MLQIFRLSSPTGARRSLRLPGRAAVAAAVALALGACSVSGPRHSPIQDATRGSPTVVDIYRGQAAGSGPAREARDRLRDAAPPRAVSAGDGDTQRYWSAIEPMRQRFARVPNPDLVMVVFPHLAKGQYPVPGYVTVFPMYETTQYALPGEVEEDLLQGRSRNAQAAQPGSQDRGR